MQKIPFRESEGPYSIESSVNNPESNQMEQRELLFNVRTYGPEVGKRPTVFMISQSSENKQGDIAIVAPRIAAELCREFEINGFEPGVTFIVHYPENVHGHNPESFVKAEFEYSGSSPQWNHNSTEIKPEEVARLIGPENMEQGYDASPRKSQNPLAEHAFKSGIDR